MAMQSVSEKPANDLVKVTLSAVQMRHNRLLECSVRANPAFGPVPVGEIATYEGLVINQRIEFGLMDQSENAYVGKLTIEAKDDIAPNNKVAPYFFRVIVEGLFELKAQPPKGIDAGQVVAVHGTASLTAAIREIISTITARSEHGVFIIPSLVFSSNPEAKPRTEEEAEKG